jgi:hypothetical protein
MDDLYELLLPEAAPARVLLCGLDNVIDAGAVAAHARTVVADAGPLEVVARFDADLLVDHQARRPVLHLRDGVNTGLTWPAIELLAGGEGGGRFLLLRGAEPDHRWRAFSAAVAGLAQRFGVELVAGLGAYPAPAPHTRPVLVVSTATSDELAAKIGYMPGALDVPASVSAAVELACAEAGIQAAGLWAQVPHYVANFPYPPSVVALIDTLTRVTGLTFDIGALRREAEATLARLDQLVAQNSDHQAMVRQLESVVDSQQLGSEPLPSADELAEAFEQFLRGENE